MYKITLLLSLLLLSIFLTAAENCSETASYKLNLTADDPDVKEFIEDGWKKLVEYNRSDGATNYTHSGLFKAQLRVEDNQRKYTILAYYISYNREVKFYYCYLFIYPIMEYIDCYSTGPDRYVEAKFYPQYRMYNFLDNWELI
ncbi:GSCOCG00009709001-RA-CDS [Cotesia congregata]|nr:GSCOCG00009709001-RA-CDS [Cotesia congregata]